MITEERLQELERDPREARPFKAEICELVAAYRAQYAVPDGAHEALQRMIEDGLLKGPASREDALTVAKYRRSLLTQPLIL